MPVVGRKHHGLDVVIGWQGAAAHTRARLLKVFCTGIRLRSLLSNTVTLLIVGGFIIVQTPTPAHVAWLLVLAACGFLPRVYAARLNRLDRFEEAPEARALVFVAISAFYGLVWGVGPLILLPHIGGAAVGVLLMVMVLGAITGPYAAMPGILYLRLATSGTLTLIAVALNESPTVTAISAVIAAWLVLRTDIWRGYHRVLRQQLELHETLEDRQRELEQANSAKEQANRNLRLMAETDPLTTASNRRQFMRTLRDLQGPAALVLFDIDRFKSANDRYGHQAGDAILVELVLRIRGLLREGDLLARLGGDEFAVVLPDMDEVGAAQVAERMRTSVQGRSLDIDGDAISLTISLGIGVIPQRTRLADAPMFLNAADAALYAAKRQGRNRVVVAGKEDAGARAACVGPVRG